VHPDRQVLVRELVEHIEHAELPAIMRAILDEVVGPHVIAMLRAQADARAVRQPAGRRQFPVSREQAENNIAYLEAIGRSITVNRPVPVER
jgi:hypothetical protein